VTSLFYYAPSSVTITALQKFHTFLNSVNMGQMPISILQEFSPLPPELNAPNDMQKIRIQMWAA
jgi:hypothetical protein